MSALSIGPISPSQRAAAESWLERVAARPWLPADWADSEEESGDASSGWEVVDAQSVQPQDRSRRASEADRDELWGAWNGQALVGLVRARILPGRLAQLSGLRGTSRTTPEMIAALLKAFHRRLAELGVELVVVLSVDEDRFNDQINLLQSHGYQFAARSVALTRSLSPAERDDETEAETELWRAQQESEGPQDGGGPDHERSNFFACDQTASTQQRFSDRDDLARPGEGAPTCCNWVPYQPGDEARLARCLDAAYDGSLDVPLLCQLRRTKDVVETYLHLGRNGRRHWYFVQESDRDIGCLLLQDHPTANQLEVMYLGFAKAVRGRGWGRRCIDFADQIARKMGRRELVTSVDPQNLPAVRLYSQTGFEPQYVNRLLVRSLVTGMEAARSAEQA